MNANDIRTTITNTIIESLEAGGLPAWRKPWAADPNGLGLATSLSTGRPYNGINQLLLQVLAMKRGYQSRWFGTFNQIKQAGASVQKGAKAVQVILFRPVSRERINESGEQVEQRRVVTRLEVRADLEDERYLALGGDGMMSLIDALRHSPLRLFRCVGVVRAAEQFGPSALDGCRHRRSVRGNDAVDLAAKVIGCLLELGHLVAAERVGVGESGLDGLVAALRQIAEGAAVRRKERRRVVVDRPLRTVQERLDGVNQVLLGFQQVVT